MTTSEIRRRAEDLADRLVTVEAGERAPSGVPIRWTVYLRVYGDTGFTLIPLHTTTVRRMAYSVRATRAAAVAELLMLGAGLVGGGE